MLAQAQSHFNVGEGGADLTQWPRPDEAPQPGGQGPVTLNRRERESKALAAAERGMLCVFAPKKTTIDVCEGARTQAVNLTQG